MPVTTRGRPVTLDLLSQAQDVIGARLGLDFAPRRGDAFQRKLERALQSSSATDLPTIIARLASSAPESPELMRFARHLTVGETYFFRDRACFRALEEQVLPALIAARRAAGLLQLRLWSAGCSTGEEAYSLAILMDRLLPDAADWRLTILASDINPDSLQRAREARYGEWSFRGTPRWVRDRYFRQVTSRTYELVPHIRERVRFRPVNLVEGVSSVVGSEARAMDLILCRNVLMYFTEEARRKTVARLQQSLVSGGWLAVAPPEASAALLAPLQVVNFPGTTLFQKRSATPVPAPRESAPSAPASRRWTSAPAPAAEFSISPPAGEEAPLTRRAREFANQGQLTEARSLCEAAIRKDSLDVEPLLLLATVCEASDDVAAALDALRRALYLDPDCILAEFTLAMLLLRQPGKARGQRLLQRVADRLRRLPPSTLLEHGEGITAGELIGRSEQWLATL